MQEEDLWPPERVAFLTTWWPHFGTYYFAAHWGLTRRQVQTQAAHLQLVRLPRGERLCVQCRAHRQMADPRGLLCRTCHLARRLHLRQAHPRSLTQWIQEAVNLARYRSKTPSDLTAAALVDRWYAQGGRCFYSGQLLTPPQYGRKRDPYSASLDRLDSTGGYTLGNVVWAAWICNVGKGVLSVAEYLALCAQVAQRHVACCRVIPDLADEP